MFPKIPTPPDTTSAPVAMELDGKEVRMDPVPMSTFPVRILFPVTKTLPPINVLPVMYVLPPIPTPPLTVNAPVVADPDC